MNWFAIASLGAYPTPGVTATQRAAYAVSYGLLGTMAAAITNRGSTLLMMLVDK